MTHPVVMVENLCIDARRRKENVSFAPDPGDAPGFHGTVASFVAGDTIDLAGFSTSHETLTYTANASKTGGVLKVVSGAETTSFQLAGQYVAAGFHTATDSAGTGTSLTYSPPAQNTPHLAFAYA